MAEENVCRVLLVEDESTICHLVEMMLALVKLVRYEVISVKSVREARQMLQQQKFNVTILDRKVEGLELGTVLIEEIKAMPSRPAILGYWSGSFQDTTKDQDACDWYCEKSELISRNQLPFAIEHAMHKRDNPNVEEGGSVE